MDYALTEQQHSFREAAERFSREKLAPHYQKRAREHRLDRALLRLPDPDSKAREYARFVTDLKQARREVA